VLQILTCLKAVQPATRLLHVHCAMVKTRQQIGALNSAAALKKELEALLFEVKVLLAANGCRETFWMGNLKHKDLNGNETSSQMAVERPEKNGKRKKTEVQDLDEEGEEEEEEEGEGDEDERGSNLGADDDDDDDDDDADAETAY
jgi:Fanconi anemia group D2 protein